MPWADCVWWSSCITRSAAITPSDLSGAHARIHFIQHWLNLADLACEEATYDNASLRRFVGTHAGCEAVPDATTLLNDGRDWALSPRAWSAGPALACRRHPALLLSIGRPRKPLTRAALQQIVKGIFRGAAL